MRILTSSIMALALAAVAPQDGARAAAGRPGSAAITATFDHSEWRPPGSVTLDLRTGRYVLRRVPRMRELREDIPVSVRHERLGAAQLDRIRSASEAARATRLVDPTCRSGPDMQTIVVSNAGPVMMRLTGAGGRLVTPDRRECWSEAAENLYAVLEEVFGPEVYPRGQ